MDDKQKRHVRIVDEGKTYSPMLEYRIHGKGPQLGFTLERIPEDVREWLVEVVTRQYFQAYEYGRRTKKKEILDHLYGISRGLDLDLSKLDRSR